MKNSPLQLDDYFLSELQFTLLMDTSDVPLAQQFEPLSIKVNADTKMRGRDSRKWRCKLSVSSKGEKDGKYPYSFNVEYVGLFSVIDEFPAEHIEQMVKTNAPAVLYSSVREVLMFLTGRGRLTAVMLPSVTFLEPPKKPTGKRKVAKKK